MLLSRHPTKGLLHLAVSLPFAGLLWVLLVQIFGLSYSAATVVFAVCFANFWHLGVSLGGLPGGLITQNRIWRGFINWTLAMLFVWFTLSVWSWIYDAPFYETPVVYWAQNCIFWAVFNLFMFRNQFLTPWDIGEIVEWKDNPRQPINGIANFVFAGVFMSTAMYFIPPMWGLKPFYIPWYWFPIAVVVVDMMDGWPFDKLGYPRTGIFNTAIIIVGTIIMIGICSHIGLDFFDQGVSGSKAAIWAAIWADVTLIMGWNFNMWPIGHWVRWKKTVVGLITSVVISIIFYVAIIETIPSASYDQVMFWLFAWMWALVSLCGPGYFHLYLWGYEANPRGSGLGGSGHSGK
jgi:hypothetical protein